MSEEPGGAEAVAESKTSKKAKKPASTSGGKRPASETADVARNYFRALQDRDADRMVACWKPGGIDRIVPLGDFRAPDEVRQLFAETFTAFPDLKAEVLDLVADEEHAAIRWRMAGTFAGGPFQGFDPTGAHVELEGLDLLRVADGLVQHNDAYYDGADFARQLGMLPARDSRAEEWSKKAFNWRKRMARKLVASPAQSIAEGVWLIRGGFPSKAMNVYLIADGDGVTVYDTGVSAMSGAIATAAYQMGGIKRVVLGHSHCDHRGSAPALGAPVFCHPAEVADAEGDGGLHRFDFGKFQHRLSRPFYARMLPRWDGGPVKIAGTVNEGDDVAGFKVIHLPGHAPGQIGLWRESDRLALVSDTIYTLDLETGLHGPPRVPHPAFTPDYDQARASVRKLAELDPRIVWSGHAKPVTGDVKSHLEQAAAA